MAPFCCMYLIKKACKKVMKVETMRAQKIDKRNLWMVTFAIEKRGENTFANI